VQLYFVREPSSPGGVQCRLTSDVPVDKGKSGVLESMRSAFALFLLSLVTCIAARVSGQQPSSQGFTGPEFNLTARPWSPLKVPKELYLDALEGLCRFSVKHQDAAGAIIDPYVGWTNS
jgi:hypothetical protein